jgi:hypothetical protein
MLTCMRSLAKYVLCINDNILPLINNKWRVKDENVCFFGLSSLFFFCSCNKALWLTGLYTNNTNTNYVKTEESKKCIEN